MALTLANLAYHCSAECKTEPTKSLFVCCLRYCLDVVHYNGALRGCILVRVACENELYTTLPYSIAAKPYWIQSAL